MRPRPTGALAALFLGGCSVAPPPAPPPPQPPSAWQAAAAGAETVAPPEVWWATFGQPQLVRLIAEALEANRELSAAAARVEAAAAQARIAGADLAPQLGVGLDSARQKRNFIGFPIPGADGPVLSTTTTTLSAAVNVSWEADLWGRLRAGRAAAEAGLAATEAEYRAARLSLCGQVAKAWFGLLEAAGQVELARTTLANRRLTREQIDSRYRAGLRGPLDLRLARSAERSAAALLAQRRRQLEAAARRLDLLVSRYPAAELAAVETQLPELPAPVPAGLPAELVARRPDLVAAERRLAAAGLRVAQARAALYPSLRLTGAGGSSSQEVRDLLDSDFSVWSLAGSLLQPIFRSGRLRANVDLGTARQREAASLYAQAVLRAFAEVESALAAEAYLAEQLAALTGAAAEAGAASRLAEDRYRRGVGDYLAVLEAQRQALVTRIEQRVTHRALLETRVDLHLALGGDLQGPPPPIPSRNETLATH